MLGLRFHQTNERLYQPLKVIANHGKQSLLQAKKLFQHQGRLSMLFARNRVHASTYCLMIRWMNCCL
jgi:hypothetical protein